MAHSLQRLTYSLRYLDQHKAAGNALVEPQQQADRKFQAPTEPAALHIYKALPDDTCCATTTTHLLLCMAALVGRTAIF
jgi:hypothetical protein